ncbi:hypothetical protein HH303_18855 [Rhodospirillaceae bacterium KN72]|uniref:PD-(D/E)XK nuclease superfamily protein n=1 Tax=Pacificispira spongiicola TaxID=2729598 RepID=A0A7Y0E3J8_9PROT|nr:hypothetical protein [Pacificispira spongiicola]NMM46558.1 hypothetical protein [Pacificispira spongiicola]
MKALFRLYESDGFANTATVFDLIAGSGREPRQTKALGYVLSKSPALLRALLRISSVARVVKGIVGQKNPKFDQIIVDAEMIGLDNTGKIRADLVVRFLRGHAPVFALVIEAKTAKGSNASDDSIINQVRRYVTPGVLTAVKAFPVVPIALTRTKRILPDIASVTWNDIRLIAHQHAPKDQLVGEFLRFLQRMGNDMQFYEREILSVPAGGTAKAIEETCIHACPDTPSFSYKTPLRIAFREKGGGAMSKLYRVLDIISFDPLDPVARSSVFESSLSNDEKERLAHYLEARDVEFGWGDRGAPFRFYILSTDDIIHLPHSPRPVKNIQGHMYFRLCDVLDSEKPVVQSA